MNSITRFTVLIERRAAQGAAATVMALALLAAALGVTPAHAQPLSSHVRAKMAQELHEETNSVRAPGSKWARDVQGIRHVQVVVIGDGADAAMTELRAHVLRIGGSVHAWHPSFRALTVQVPASQVQALAQRADVLSVSPNRTIHRTSSTLEAVTGALTSNVRTYSSKTSYSGIDGAGVGIAILDSGVMRLHDIE